MRGTREALYIPHRKESRREESSSSAVEPSEKIKARGQGGEGEV